MSLLFLKHLTAKALLLLVLHSAVVPHGPKAQVIPLMVTGQFDAATTFNVDRYRTLHHEDNPLLKPFAPTPMIFPAMALADSMTLNLVNRYGKHHKIIGYVIVGAFIGLHIGCGFHNLSLQNNKH